MIVWNPKLYQNGWNNLRCHHQLIRCLIPPYSPEMTLCLAQSKSQGPHNNILSPAWMFILFPELLRTSSLPPSHPDFPSEAWLSCCSSNVMPAPDLGFLVLCFKHPSPRFPSKYLCKSHLPSEAEANVLVFSGCHNKIKQVLFYGFNNILLFSYSSRDWKSRIEVSAGFISSWLADGHLLLCPHTACSPSVHIAGVLHPWCLPMHVLCVSWSSLLKGQQPK